jgi:hypothetical protein
MSEKDIQIMLDALYSMRGLLNSEIETATDRRRLAAVRAARVGLSETITNLTALLPSLPRTGEDN